MTAGGWVATAGWTLVLAAVAAAVHGRARERRLRRACAVAEHELRGPLGAVRLGVEMALGRGQLCGAELRAVAGELARAECALGDLSVARDGRRPGLASSTVELSALLADSVLAWRPVADRAGVELRWEGGGGRVHADAARLAQAAGNLIANAIEHGGGRVRVSADGDGSRARVRVKDGGDGLPADAIAHAARRSRLAEAHGHGLAVAAAAARLHGGRLSSEGGDAVLELPALPPA